MRASSDGKVWRARVRARKLGGHWHCSVWTGMVPAGAENPTLAKSGDLVFDEREWGSVRPAIEAVGFEVIVEGGGGD